MDQHLENSKFNRVCLLVCFDKGECRLNSIYIELSMKKKLKKQEIWENTELVMCCLTHNKLISWVVTSKLVYIVPLLTGTNKNSLVETKWRSHLLPLDQQMILN